MAVSGVLVCKKCLQFTHLGKWLREEDRGIGFWRGDCTCEELGLETLNFLAQHMSHDLAILRDWEFDAFWDELSASGIEPRDMEGELGAKWADETR